MAAGQGRYVVTFNGEIYNYVELRDELESKGYSFHTASDTEVLLHGYAAWGTDLPRRLIGMFAFGIADRLERSLFMARDRFGEKPLLFSDDPHGVTFASELAPLAVLAEQRAIDPNALGGYLCLNYVPGTRTLLNGVRRVRPGEWRLYRYDGEIKTARFYDPFDTTNDVALPKDLLTALESRLDEAVRLALRSDVPVGMFLSGGIDSALVATSASRTGQLSRAYCLTFSEAGYSEWRGAEATAAQLGIPLTQVQMSSDALTDFLSLVEHADDPLADSSAIAVWTVSRVASESNKVVLTGDGGDELFGGYLTYRATLWHQLIPGRLPAAARGAIAGLAPRLRTSDAKVSTSFKLLRFLRAADLAPSEAHLTWNGTWLPAEAADLVASDYRESALQGLRRLVDAYPIHDYPSLRELQALDLAEYLPNDILAKSDRMGMAHGLEIRAPLLSPALAEFALSLPDDAKCGLAGHGKRLLRQLAADRYGLRVARAPKQGFSIPIHAWLRGPARPLMADLLSVESVRSLGCLDAEAVSERVGQHWKSRRALGWELWGLMILVAWHRRRVASVPALPEEAAERIDIPIEVRA